MKLKILVVATFTAQPLEASLRYWLEQLDIPCDIEFAPYSQVFQQLLDSTSALAHNVDGANLVLIRVEDWVQGATENWAAQLEKNVEDFLAALVARQERQPAPLWLCLCPPSNAMQQDADRSSAIRRTETLITERAARSAGIQVLDGSKVAARYRVAQVNDPGADAAGHVPYTPEYFAALGAAFVRALLTLVALPQAEVRVTSDAPVRGPEKVAAQTATIAPARTALRQTSDETSFAELFCSIMDISPSELTDETSPANLATWSSLAHINLITALEESYSISFTTGEILAVKSVGGLRELLDAKGLKI